MGPDSVGGGEHERAMRDGAGRKSERRDERRRGAHVGVSTRTVVDLRRRDRGDDRDAVRALVVDAGGSLGEAIVRYLSCHQLASVRVHVDDVAHAVTRQEPTAVVVTGDLPVERRAAVVGWLRQDLPGVRVITLEVERDGGWATEGTVASIDLASRPEELLAAVCGVAPRRRGRSDARGSTEPSPDRRDGALTDLTTREIQVLQQLMVGSSSPRIAEHLGISPHTVRTHVQNILGKLGVRTRHHAATLARRAGVRPPAEDRFARAQHAVAPLPR